MNITTTKKKETDSRHREYWDYNHFIYEDGKLIALLNIKKAIDSDKHILERNLSTYDSTYDKFSYEYIDNSKCTYEIISKIRKELKENPEKYIRKGEKAKAQAAAYLPSNPDLQFYPTPDWLVGKMIGKILQPEKIRTILEPSAGKGNIIDGLKLFYSKLDYRYMQEELQIDAIELDPNLRCLLKGKGVNVVFDDFLQFDNSKHYDLIIQNSPYLTADKHLLHAIELQEREGGQIIALLNAETIKNPYSTSRKVLLSKLRQHDAHIEFISNAFLKAERKTAVETALVYMNIEKEQGFFHSDIISRLKKAEEAEEENFASTSISKSNSIDAMIDNYNFEIKAGLSLIKEYASVQSYFITEEDGISLPLSLEIGGQPLCLDGKEYNRFCNRYITNVRAKYWRNFLNREELTDRMTQSMKNSYMNKITDMSHYEFDIYNIREVMADIETQLVNGMKDSLMDLFQKFSADHTWYPECSNNIHYFNGWKTNLAHKVNFPKIIVPFNAYDTDYWNNCKSLKSDRICQFVQELERALNFLNKGEISCSGYDIEAAIAEAINQGSHRIHFKYFDTFLYKKGTCHVVFKPEAKPLIDRLNIFAAQQKTWLPPCYGKKNYQHMTDEEKSVIDEFQGEAEYSKVVAEPGKYLMGEGELKSSLYLTD